MIVMCSYSKLSDLGRPLQDDLGKDTKKKDLVNKSLKKKNSTKRKWLYKKWFAMGKGQCSWMLEGKRRVMSDEEGDRCMQGIIGHGEEFGCTGKLSPLGPSGVRCGPNGSGERERKMVQTCS